METQEKVENSAAIADAIVSLPSERAQKKAARRAAFIQEVAQAVCDMQAGRRLLVSINTKPVGRGGLLARALAQA